MHTVEQAVDFLLKNPARRMLSYADCRTLVDVRRKTWWHHPAAISVKQQQLVMNLVSKYLLVLKTHRWPVEELADPKWSTPVKQSLTHTDWSITFNDAWFDLQFPFDKEIIGLLKESRHHLAMIDRVEYQPNTVSWMVENGVQGRQLVQHLLRSRPNWRVAPDVYRTIMHTPAEWPVIKYINGEWQCAYTSESFQQAFAQIVQQDLSVPATVLRLCSLQPEFDHTVQHVLRNWLRPDHIEWLMDKQATASPNQLDSLIEMARVVDLWPVIICDNKYNDGQLRSLIRDSVGIYETIHSDRDLNSSNLSSLKGFVTVWESKLSELNTNTRAPWIIYSSPYRDTYGFDCNAGNSAIRKNFDKVILVTN
jgi:hypothetical protein